MRTRHPRLAGLAATLLAVPLFLTRRNFSRAAGGVLGVATTIVYFTLVQLGEGIVHGGGRSVAAGVWLPNIVLAGVAVLLFVRSRREGGATHVVRLLRSAAYTSGGCGCPTDGRGTKGFSSQHSGEYGGAKGNGCL